MIDLQDEDLHFWLWVIGGTWEKGFGELHDWFVEYLLNRHGYVDGKYVWGVWELFPLEKRSFEGRAPARDHQR